MQQTLAILLVLTLATIIPAQDKPPTPAEQYQNLLKQLNAGGGGSRMSLSNADQIKFIGQAYQRRYVMSQRFLELAEKYPSDPVAIDALIQATWQVNTTPWPVEIVGKDTASPKAFKLLQRDHMQSDKLGTVCHRISGGFNQEYETFLRAVLEKNPHRQVRAYACLSLAHYLNNRQQRLDMVKEQPALAKEFADLFGQEYLDTLLKQDRAKTSKEAEALLEQAAEKYADIKNPWRGTVGEKARAELFELRHLSIGKIAPDIEGEDQDGQRFKLSDYRGKVVLLDFWSYV